jgi:hypothetical protein
VGLVDYGEVLALPLLLLLARVGKGSSKRLKIGGWRSYQILLNNHLIVRTRQEAGGRRQEAGFSLMGRKLNL